jgi:hypothetical protein
MRVRRRCSIVAVLLLMGMPWSAHAQPRIASLGKGWLLGALGSVTSAPGEVISGNNSIKGSGSSQMLLLTDPAVIKFAPSQSYTMTAKYHILTASPGATFAYGFGTVVGIPSGDFGTTTLLPGAAGSSGTATTTFTLHNWPDYQVQFNIGGSGSIVVDEISITDANGHLVASENAEGPTFVPGPLNFQLTDAMATLTMRNATVHGVGLKDLDGDAYPEAILTIQNANTYADFFQPIVVEASGRMRVATTDIFPAGAPTTMDTPMVLFADINGDGLQDVVLSDSGLDRAPGTGARLGVALNNGNGTYRDVSPLIPADQWTNRAYATAVGDIYGDGKVEIILPDEVDGSNPVLLRWNGNGFDEIRNWIPQSIWKDGPALLHAQDWMNLVDFDQDGKVDLLSTGNDHNPNYQIVFGGADGFTAGTLVVLPDGPFGHTQGGPQPDGTVTTAEIDPVVVADFDNDGKPDIFSGDRSIILHANGTTTYGDTTYNVRLNRGSRNFLDVSPSPYTNLGNGIYQNLFAVDMNNDGFLDVVGTFSADVPNQGQPSRTTFFLNDGTGAFQVVDGANLLGATTTPSDGQVRNLGEFVPTIVTPLRTEGIVYESFGGCGVPSACNAMNLNVYKVVANKAIGTGPNFADPATLGVPGFNEFYYLRHYPDAAAAVQAGTYPTGLAHYLAVGKALGHQPYAPNGPSLSATAQTFGTAGGGGSVSVTMPNGSGWIVENLPAWASTTSGGTGAGAGTWRFTVAPNPGATRTQVVSIAERPFTLTQLGATVKPLVASGARTAVNLANAAAAYWSSIDVVAGRSYCARLAPATTAQLPSTPALVALRGDGVTLLAGGAGARQACFIAPASETILFKLTQTDASARSYTLGVAETTLWANWFFIGGDYSSYTLLRNTTDANVHATITWRSTGGVAVSTESVTVPAHGGVFRDARATASGSAIAGSVEVAHDGEPQGLVGSQTTLSGVTGLSFDTLLLQRNP